MRRKNNSFAAVKRFYENSKPHPEKEATIREVHESDHKSIIAIFSYYAATSYAAYPEIPVNDRFFAFLREGAPRVLRAGVRGITRRGFRAAATAPCRFLPLWQQEC